ncbi:inactive serine/threonine-protein kinase 19 isoform X3 [Desmodus rotundus]|uniref:inactive serine/threonine-protein kinase 19 isoform X3 n=1 Tax=Desmodus rotundus TaxID=9430 RepID=UPI0023818B8F|nr:serine/threonine-protein kinase 19 isoform X3 [Desmodus rotundus]XP_053769894.1 serine/threonine-protein kinase 19 isoform X3 [Desmodus rotundus]
MRLGRVPGLRSRIWLLPSPPNSTPTSAEPRRPGRDTQSRRGVPRKFRRSTVQSLSDGGEQTPGARTSVAARPPRPAALPGSEDTSTRGPPSAPPLAGRARDAAGPGLRSAQSRETSLLRAGSLFSWSLPPHFLLGGPTGSRAMSRKRQRLVPETLGLKKRRERGPAGGGPERGEAVHVPVTGPLCPGSARAAVAELVRLFPRGLFEDALPPIALRSQVYSLVPDRTAADRQLVRGVGASDRSSTRLLVPPAILPFSKPRKNCRNRGRSESSSLASTWTPTGSFSPRTTGPESSRPAVGGHMLGLCRSFWLRCFQPVGTLASSRTR